MKIISSLPNLFILMAFLSLGILLPINTFAQAAPGSQLVDNTTNQIYSYVTLFANIGLALCSVSLLALLITIAANVWRKDTHGIGGQITGFVILLIVSGLLIYLRSNPRIFG
jgi:hypothetical protein